MKQKILDALKTKFVGVKDEILDRIATKGAKTVNTEDEVTTYVEGVTMQSVLDSYADFRATEATKNAVSNYEKKHNLKDGKPVTNESTKPNSEEGGNESEVMKLLGEMRNELAALKGEKTTNTRKSQLNDLLKDASDKVKNRYTKNFERYNFKDDDDFSAWLADQKKDIEADIADEKASGAKVTPPKTTTTTTGTVNPLVQARITAATDAAKATPTPSVMKG